VLVERLFARHDWVHRGWPGRQ